MKMKIKKINPIILYTNLFLLIIFILFSLSSCSASINNILSYFKIRPQIEVTLYFAKYTETSFYLEPEVRRITSDENLYKKTIEELVKGPQSTGLYPTLPASTKVISVEIENGLATVNFSKEIILDSSDIPHSSTTEILAIFSIVNTLTEFEKIERVKIIIEGKDSGKIDGMNIEDFWGHVGIYEEFTRNEDIIGKNAIQA